ncbi:MAG: MotA/TolQ/ExbB proton channel family protein [Planctomycetota bacterium]|jgi:biopolymer transport protein ExbB
MEILERGGWVMYPLLACSLAVVWVIIERALFWMLAGRTAARRSADDVLRLVEQGRLDDAAERASTTRHPVCRLLHAGLTWSDAAPSPEEALRLAGTRERDRMEHHLGLLDTIVTAAPLLGILGTVLGIIDAFDVLEHSGLLEPQGVTAGIGRALTTTAAGLVIALIALFALNAYRARTDAALDELERRGAALDRLLKR